VSDEGCAYALLIVQWPKKVYPFPTGQIRAAPFTTTITI